MAERLYLDHNATSPLRPECRDAMLDAMSRPANPSAVHAEGRAGKRIVEDARRDLAAMIGVPAESVVFTSGGTEADATGLLGLARGGLEVRRLFLSAVEHAAIPATAVQSGLPAETVPVTRDGTLDLAWLEERLAGYDAEADGTFLLCVMLANNETGVIQPVAEATAMARRAGGYTLCDAVQALGKVAIDFSSLGADVLTLSAHKAGGPVGVGALVVTPGLAFEPLLRGGGQESYRRAGTHNVAAIAGLGALARVASPSDYDWLAEERDALEAALPDGVTVLGRNAPRLPNTSFFAAPGFNSETQLLAMDLAGAAVSAGSACSSGKVRRSGTAVAMDADDDQAAAVLRVSTGWDTKRGTGEAFASLWRGEYERVARRAA